VIGYKFLRADGTAPFSGYRWELPGGRPGAWVNATADPCRSGIHACRPAHLPYWTGQSLYEIELEGEIVESASKVVAVRGRLLRHIDAWEEEVRASYQRMCGERAHRLAASAAPTLADWDELVDSLASQGPGPAGFAAARIAEEIDGPDGFRAERAAQAAWLSERLGLEPQ
jgi:hypothetical protein